MVRLSKYFTPVLGDEEKLSLTKILGLNRLAFKLVERLGDQELLVQHWLPEGTFTKVSDNSFSDFGEGSPQLTVGEIIIHHSNLLRDLKEEENSGVFGGVLAYPYSEIFKADSIGKRLEFAPSEFNHNVQTLRQVVVDFEALMGKHELCVLWIRGNQETLPLLCHFVRRKLIRVGTMTSLGELTKGFEMKQLKPSDLKQFFGTNAAFFELNLSLFSEMGCPIQKLKASMARCLTSPESKILGEPVYQFETSSYPDLEL